MLLLALFSHKRRPDVTEVRPKQCRLADMMACSVRTVQRGLIRLEKADLLVKRYWRDAQGRLHGLRYDLAKTIALLSPPRGTQKSAPQAAQKPPSKVTTVSPGCPLPLHAVPALVPAQISRNRDLEPKRQPCRPESESDVAEVDNTAPASPVPPVAQKMMSAGVLGRIAVRLHDRFGEERCRQALDALARRRNIENGPAWLYRCLTEGWTLAPPAPPRPRSQHPYVPPAAPAGGGGGPDALDALPPARVAALDSAARAQLSAEIPALRGSFAGGGSRRVVRARMRSLLAAEGGGG